MKRFSRRRFLTAAGAAGLTPAASRLRADPLGVPIGLGLYTVADVLQKDWDGTLRQIAAIGYREVEISLFQRPPAEQVRRTLRAAGMTAISTHLTQSPDPIEFDYALAVGAHYVVMSAPGVPDPSRLKPADSSWQAQADAYTSMLDSFTLDDWKWHAQQLNRRGEAARKAGLQFAYHTHGVDFRRYGDLSAFELVMGDTDAALVKVELDCGWAVNAGVDPAELLRRYPGRIHLLHIKDVSRGFAPSTGFKIDTVPIGVGAIDWKRLFRAAGTAGVKHYFVELEPPFVKHSAIDSIKESYDYLHALKV